MIYNTYQPHPELEPLVSCYWTLEVPAAEDAQRQRIIPDGTIEIAFILADDIKRFTSGDEFILQPRAMVLGQTMDPFYIEPVGAVETFAIRFYPYGFANLVTVPLSELANKETPLSVLFGEEDSKDLERKIIQASGVNDRIRIIESFLRGRLNEPSAVDTIVKRTLDILLRSKGSTPINAILKDDPSKRRQLERKFAKTIGISPKQLGRVIRLQAALTMLLNEEDDNLASIAYRNEYYDQAHFNKDFKDFTGISPRQFLNDESMSLSALFYR